MIRRFITIVRNEFQGYNFHRLIKDLMAGVTVAAVALPLALAFGVSSGADAAAGLITAILSGFVMSLLSGASFQISGPTGAMTAVLVTIVSRYSLQGVFLTCLIAGILLFLAGVFKVGKAVNFIPAPVITGFTSGIAVVIALGQIDNFFGTVSKGDTVVQKIAYYLQNGFPINLQITAIGLLVVLIMILWPKKWNAKFPSSLVAIIVAGIVAAVLKMDIPAVGQIPQTLFPENRLELTQIDFARIPALLAPAFTIAILGMIESLLCASSASRMKNEDFDADCELVAQGIGNMIIPFFGGVPSTAAIARTSVAIKSGCQTRLTGVFHSIFLLLCMFLLGPVIAKLPLAALAGVLMVTAWRMNDWESIRYLFAKKFKGAIVKFTVTMIATVVFDLTIAIILGIAFSLIIFVINISHLEIAVSKVENDKLKHSDRDVETSNPDTAVIYITGPIFFANSDTLFEHLKECDDAKRIIFSLRGVPLVDITVISALMDFCKSEQAKGKEIFFCGVQDKVKQRLKRAGFYDCIGDDQFYWSVDKALLALC